MRTQHRIIILTHETLRKEIKFSNLGPQYTMEIKPNWQINEIIIGTENAFRKTDIKWQNTYKYLAAKVIKEINEIVKQNILHKSNLI